MTKEGSRLDSRTILGVLAVAAVAIGTFPASAGVPADARSIGTILSSQAPTTELAAPMAALEPSDIDETAVPPRAIGATARPIPLGEALSLAQQNALAILEAAGQRRTRDAEVRSAYAAFLPSVSLSAGATRQLPAEGNRTRVENGQVITVPTDPWSSSVGLGASVTLFEGGRRIFDLQQARARQILAGINESSQEFAVALLVKEQYFDILAAQETESAARAQLAQALQQSRAANARLRARTATRSDSLRAAIQVRTAELAVRGARDAAEVASAALTRLVGSPDPVTAAAPELLESDDLQVGEDSLRAWAEGGPSVRQAELTLSAARVARRAAWGAYLPSVSMSYSRGGNGTSQSLSWDTDEFSYVGSIRLSLSLPVFNQLQREGQVTQADVALRNAEAALRDARLTARSDAERLLVAYHSARDRVGSQELNVEAAAEDLRVQELRYAGSESTLLELLTSQTQLDQARRDLIRARYDRRVAKAQFEALVGRNL